MGVTRFLVRARARLAVQKPWSVRLSSPSSVVLALVLSLEKGTETGKTEGEGRRRGGILFPCGIGCWWWDKAAVEKAEAKRKQMRVRREEEGGHVVREDRERKKWSRDKCFQLRVVRAQYNRETEE